MVGAKINYLGKPPPFTSPQKYEISAFGFLQKVYSENPEKHIGQKYSQQGRKTGLFGQGAENLIHKYIDKSHPNPKGQIGAHPPPSFRRGHRNPDNGQDKSRNGKGPALVQHHDIGIDIRSAFAPLHPDKLVEFE